jgi:RHH-type proline utilization regulon transcriptional repressor/proline dehydrogenase/delta 1-pyrroline-5-carboxylate dehydrogenase
VNPTSKIWAAKRSENDHIAAQILDEGDQEDVERAVALAAALLDDARRAEPPPARRRARRLQRLLDDDAGMALSLALTDQVARIPQAARATRRLHDLVAATGVPSSLGPLDHLALRAGAVLGRWLPGIVDAGVRWRLQRESAGIVLPAEDPAFSRYVARRHDAGIRLNVNVLGEAVLGDGEARRRQADVLARVDRPDVDYVSVKVSSVCAQVSSLAFDRSVERIAERLGVLYRRAAASDPPVFVNLDMEEHRDLELTLTVFQRVLSEPDLIGLDAGIVLQAYLPDAHDAFERVAAWAVDRRARGGGGVKVRLVKGANLAMERVDAELGGWAPAPYPTKADTDASYKRLIDRALDPRWGDALRIGLASHNLFDVAWGLVRAERHGTGNRLGIEMLEGMAPGEAEAVRRRAGGVLLYAPVVRHDELDAAIAYLVRRLDENTSPENYLHHQFDLAPGSAAFTEQRDRFAAAVAARHTVPTAPRRDQDRSTERRHLSLDGPFANEPDTDWSVAANREWLDRHLAAAARQIPHHIPAVVGGEEVSTGTIATGVDPSAPGAPLYRYTLADRALTDRAVSVARGAVDDWSVRPARARAERLLRCAEVLADHRGEAIAVMALDAGKTVAQSDPEVSEAIDMATWYARSALGLEDFDADHRPLGPVVVAPPWNFPYAIPAGGVFAALAAGNPVILKPAPETVATAWRLVTCLWDAGVPRDVLQFLPCPDDEVGRALITHPDVGAVILTGSADTARRFLDWKPDLRLHAETSGKNAMVVTAAADLDLAVKDIVASAFGHAGQKCSAVSVVIAEQAVLDDGRFLAKLADATRSLHTGPGTDPSVDVGPLISPPNERLDRALHHLDEDERWLVEPRRLDDAGHLWTPGIRVGVRPGSFLHRTELFGPVLAVMAAADLDDAVRLQNDTDFGLTGGLHSLDPAEIERWLAAVEVGNAYVNRSTTGAVVGRQPFGGWKRSAVGPAAKAGGPDYVVSLAAWTDRPGDRLARASQDSYPGAWTALSRPSDRSGLAAERNEHRHVPLPLVVLRVEDGADPVDVELCLLAAATTGTTVAISRAADEPVEHLIEQWGASGPGMAGTKQRPDRLRVLGPVPERLRRAAAEAWIALDDRVPVADGRVELPRWCREQTVSRTAHRHGNIRLGA